MNRGLRHCVLERRLLSARSFALCNAAEQSKHFSVKPEKCLKVNQHSEGTHLLVHRRRRIKKEYQLRGTQILQDRASRDKFIPFGQTESCDALLTQMKAAAEGRVATLSLWVEFSQQVLRMLPYFTAAQLGGCLRMCSIVGFRQPVVCQAIFEALYWKSRLRKLTPDVVGVVCEAATALRYCPNERHLVALINSVRFHQVHKLTVSSRIRIQTLISEAKLACYEEVRSLSAKKNNIDKQEFKTSTWNVSSLPSNSPEIASLTTARLDSQRILFPSHHRRRDLAFFQWLQQLFLHCLRSLGVATLQDTLAVCHILEMEQMITSQNALLILDSVLRNKEHLTFEHCETLMTCFARAKLLHSGFHPDKLTQLFEARVQMQSTNQETSLSEAVFLLKCLALTDSWHLKSILIYIEDAITKTLHAIHASQMALCFLSFHRLRFIPTRLLQRLTSDYVSPEALYVLGSPLALPLQQLQHLTAQHPESPERNIQSRVRKSAGQFHPSTSAQTTGFTHWQPTNTPVCSSVVGSVENEMPANALLQHPTVNASLLLLLSHLDSAVLQQLAPLVRVAVASLVTLPGSGTMPRLTRNTETTVAKRCLVSEGSSFELHNTPTDMLTSQTQFSVTGNCSSLAPKLPSQHSSCSAHHQSNVPTTTCLSDQTIERLPLSHKNGSVTSLPSDASLTSQLTRKAVLSAPRKLLAPPFKGFLAPRVPSNTQLPTSQALKTYQDGFEPDYSSCANSSSEQPNGMSSIFDLISSVYETSCADTLSETPQPQAEQQQEEEWMTLRVAHSSHTVEPLHCSTRAVTHCSEHSDRNKAKMRGGLKSSTTPWTQLSTAVQDLSRQTISYANVFCDRPLSNDRSRKPPVGMLIERRVTHTEEWIQFWNRLFPTTGHPGWRRLDRRVKRQGACFSLPQYVQRTQRPAQFTSFDVRLFLRRVHLEKTRNFASDLKYVRLMLRARAAFLYPYRQLACYWSLWSSQMHPALASCLPASCVPPSLRLVVHTLITQLVKPTTEAFHLLKEHPVSVEFKLAPQQKMLWDLWASLETFERDIPEIKTTWIPSEHRNTFPFFKDWLPFVLPRFGIFRDAELNEILKQNINEIFTTATAFRRTQPDRRLLRQPVTLNLPPPNVLVNVNILSPQHPPVYRQPVTPTLPSFEIFTITTTSEVINSMTSVLRCMESSTTIPPHLRRLCVLWLTRSLQAFPRGDIDNRLIKNGDNAVCDHHLRILERLLTFVFVLSRPKMLRAQGFRLLQRPSTLFLGRLIKGLCLERETLMSQLLDDRSETRNGDSQQQQDAFCYQVLVLWITCALRGASLSHSALAHSTLSIIERFFIMEISGTELKTMEFQTLNVLLQYALSILQNLSCCSSISLPVQRWCLNVAHLNLDILLASAVTTSRGSPVALMELLSVSREEKIITAQTLQALVLCTRRHKQPLAVAALEKRIQRYCDLENLDVNI